MRNKFLPVVLFTLAILLSFIPGATMAQTTPEEAAKRAAILKVNEGTAEIDRLTEAVGLASFLHEAAKADITGPTVSRATVDYRKHQATIARLAPLLANGTATASEVTDHATATAGLATAISIIRDALDQVDQTGAALREAVTAMKAEVAAYEAAMALLIAVPATVDLSGIQEQLDDFRMQIGTFAADNAKLQAQVNTHEVKIDAGVKLDLHQCKHLPASFTTECLDVKAAAKMP